MIVIIDSKDQGMRWLAIAAYYTVPFAVLLAFACSMHMDLQMITECCVLSSLLYILAIHKYDGCNLLHDSREKKIDRLHIIIVLIT